MMWLPHMKAVLAQKVVMAQRMLFEAVTVCPQLLAQLVMHLR